MRIPIRHKDGKFYLIRALFVGLLLFSGGRVYATKFFSLVNVSNLPNQIDTGSTIAIDKNNKVHIAWSGFYAQAEAPDGVAGDVFYTTNKDGSFSTPVKISVPTGWYSRDVTIAVDPSGKVHIAFRRSEDQTNVLSEDDIYYVTNTLGDFNSPVCLVDGIYGFDPTTVRTPYSPRIHCDSQGYVHLTFCAFGIGSLNDVVAYMNDVTGSWSEPIVAADAYSLIDYNSSLDKNGHIHIAFGDFLPDILRVFYTHNAGGSFEAPIAASPSDGDADEPNLAVDSKGNAHIVYKKTAPGTTALYYVNNIGGSFGTDQPISDGSMYYLPTVACDASDFVHIAYKIMPAFGGALYYGNNIGGDFSFDTYEGMNSYWFPGWSQNYMVLGKNGTMHFAFYDWVGDVYDSDTEIYYLSGSWLDLDDLVGTWDGQGVYFRNSETGNWVKLSSPADLIAAGDLDGDGKDDLIGIWSGQGGVWVKYSKTGAWSKLSSTATHIGSGDMNGDGRGDFLGTWDGQGVYYRDSISGVWAKLASPATLITAGDLDGDNKDDLIGIWPTQGGVWVKYSETGAWAKLSSTARDIAAGDMNGDGRADLLATWDGQGVYYRDSITGSWVKMATPADQVTCGDIDGDGTEDLIGIWAGQGGVWVKYSETGSWAKLSSTARDIAAGVMSGGAWGSSGVFDSLLELSAPVGGYAEGPLSQSGYLDLSVEGPGGWRFAAQEEKDLIPRMTRKGLATPGPGDPGFTWTEQDNLVPQEEIETRQPRRTIKKTPKE